MRRRAKNDGSRDVVRVVDDRAAGMRLDQAIATLLPDMSRGAARRAIADGRVFVAGRRTRQNSLTVSRGVDVRVAAPASQAVIPAPEPSVLFEDDAVAVVVKPVGMPVEPTRAGDSGTLVRWFKDRGVVVHVVHRLDEVVSGVLVVAKKAFALKRLNEMLRARGITRRYRAVVEGVVREDVQTLDAPLLHRGKMRDARTHVRVVARCAATTVVDIELETGRTHQIRRHLAGVGHPIVGDEKYGAKTVAASAAGISLWAVEIAFTHPRSGEPMRFHFTPPSRD